MTTRVAVLLGGLSAERAVSLISGQACAEALVRKGYDVKLVDAGRDLYRKLEAAAPDIVFNALHGEWGEDGRVQGVLEHFGKPYTHSGVLASALAMDKERAKAVFRDIGIDTPQGYSIPRGKIGDAHLMEPPYVVKPVSQGSSVGVFIVRPGDNRPPAALTASEWDLGEMVMVEEYIPGRELTVTVLDDRPLAVTEIVPDTAFYDYEAKYAEGGSRHVVPALVDPDAAGRAMKIAAAAHAALGCRGVTRADFRYDESNNRLAILEVNTQPGMTPTSLAPEQAAHVGIAFDDLVAWIAEDASCPR